jgi:hypothetical protein
MSRPCVCVRVCFRQLTESLRRQIDPAFSEHIVLADVEDHLRFDVISSAVKALVRASAPALVLWEAGRDPTAVQPVPLWEASRDASLVPHPLPFTPPPSLGFFARGSPVGWRGQSSGVACMLDVPLNRLKKMNWVAITDVGDQSGACCVLRVACCVLRVACCVLRVACCVLRVACAACCVLRAAGCRALPSRPLPPLQHTRPLALVMPIRVLVVRTGVQALSFPLPPRVDCHPLTSPRRVRGANVYHSDRSGAGGA